MPEARETPPGFLRPFEPRQDAEVVARLIEQAFELQNDPDGQEVLRQIRQAARLQAQTYGLGLRSALPGAYVWEVRGKVVGNINLIPFTAGLHRVFLIANVAVEPEYRNAGIATRLTSHALQMARQWGASEVWLQVRSDNSGAIRLYERLGFRYFSALSQWKLESTLLERIRARLPLADGFITSPRRRADWARQEGWLRQAYPPETRWYLGVNFNDFPPNASLNPLRWPGLMSLHHFSTRSQAGLAAVLTWQKTVQPADNLWLAAEPGLEESRNLRPALEAFINHVWDGRPLALDYPYLRAADALTGVGFRLSRNLNWMRYHPPA